MSVRELHLCDKPGCDDKFVALCVFCGVDCCEGHMGDSKIVVLLQLATKRSTDLVLGECRFQICGSCSLVLARMQHPARFTAPEGFTSTIEQIIKARLAGEALSREGEPNV